MNAIKPNLWLNSVNPAINSALNDQWCFDIPISHKPTYVSMEIVDYNLQFSDLVDDTNWNFNALNLLFINSDNPLIRSLGRINPESENS